MGFTCSDKRNEEILWKKIRRVDFIPNAYCGKKLLQSEKSLVPKSEKENCIGEILLNHAEKDMVS